MFYPHEFQQQTNCNLICQRNVILKLVSYKQS